MTIFDKVDELFGVMEANDIEPVHWLKWGAIALLALFVTLIVIQ